MTRIISSLAGGAAREAAQTVSRAAREGLGGMRPELLVAFASTTQPLEVVAATLSADFPGVPLIGASTAGEFIERRDAKSSIALFALAGDYKVFVGMGDGLRANPDAAIAKAIEGLPREVHGYPHRTALLLLDPLAGNGEEATLIAAARLGPNVRLAGGAAGDDLAMKATQVLGGRRCAGDAVVVALLFSRKPLGVGVCHGHRPLSPPLRVTRAEGNVVHEIEGRPAWDVWLERTRDHARSANVAPPTAETEGEYLLRFEAGLAAGAEYKIRAPLARTSDGAISFACGIPMGTVIRITESDPERQVASAREAARQARAQLGADKPAGALVFDCICRKLILRDHFERAVRGMAEELGDVPLAGFETYGEIALDVGDMSGFHNTTSVVLAFPE
jgi:hypothetical protein